MITILDCYTDEPAGLGVPPYLGTYPRYLYGHLKSKVSLDNKNKDIKYITIDDLRLAVNYAGKILYPTPKQKTNISTTNLTVNYENVNSILAQTNELYIVLGVHTPGKYLSATPGTLKELSRLLVDFKGKKILTGPVVMGGTQLFGGENTEVIDSSYDKFDVNFPFHTISYLSIAGAELIKQIPDIRMIEIETQKGCSRNVGCSFCTEPLKNKFSNRKMTDVLAEMQVFYSLGARFFRLGKQTCIYDFDDIVPLLEEINKTMPEIKVLHIDNCNPTNVIADFNSNDAKITKALVKYCTAGNIAAFGVESFDMSVIEQNILNTTPELTLKAIEIINTYGRERGSNGVPKFLPGVNIIFGLIGETKKTHQENMKYLTEILDKFMLRRINIREVIPYEGTLLHKKVGNSIVRKNKKFYWKWRDEIRQKIDMPMLKKVFPTGTILTDCYAEIYDGNTTFLRQLGSYPIIIGVKGRVELKKFYSVRVKSHMLRSLVGEISTGSTEEKLEIDFANKFSNSSTIKDKS